MIIDKNNSEIKIITELIQPKNKTILEIGCGDGNIAKLLSPLCNQYIGIDVDKKSMNKAKKLTKNLSNLSFFTRSGDSTKLEDKSIDTVLMHLCLHEVPPQKQGLVLQEIHRLLKKNGQLLIIDPTEPAGQIQAMFNIGYQNFWFFHHSTIVQHSIRVIKQVITNGLFLTKQISKLEIEYIFKDFDEIFNFVKDGFSQVNWTKNNLDALKKDLLKITDKQKQNITLIDDLTITNLIKTN